MGAGPRVAAVSSYDRYPPEVGRLPRVGALVDPDVERILSLRPDLVVAYASQTDLLAQLGRAGIPVYIYRHGSLADITAGMRALGSRIGMPAEAERAAADIEHGLAEVRASVAGRPRPRTVLVIGREPQSLRAISVSGGFGFLHDLLDLAGGDNVFGDVKRESMMVATETILAKQPDVISSCITRTTRCAMPKPASATRGSCCPGCPPSGTAASTCSTAANWSYPGRAWF